MFPSEGGGEDEDEDEGKANFAAEDIDKAITFDGSASPTSSIIILRRCKAATWGQEGEARAERRDSMRLGHMPGPSERRSAATALAAARWRSGGMSGARRRGESELWIRGMGSGAARVALWEEILRFSSSAASTRAIRGAEDVVMAAQRSCGQSGREDKVCTRAWIWGRTAGLDTWASAWSSEASSGELERPADVLIIKDNRTQNLK